MIGRYTQAYVQVNIEDIEPVGLTKDGEDCLLLTLDTGAILFTKNGDQAVNADDIIGFDTEEERQEAHKRMIDTVWKANVKVEDFGGK